MNKSAITPRSISPEELAVIAQAVRVGAIKGSKLPSLDSLASLRVIGKCDCGCASVDFEQLGTGQAPSLVADAIGDTPGGERVNLLVFAYGGRFTALEVVGYAADPVPLPIPSSVRAW